MFDTVFFNFPTSTDFLANIGELSVPFFENLLPLVYIACGLLIGGLLVRWIINTVIAAVMTAFWTSVIGGVLGGISGLFKKGTKWHED